MLDKRLNILVKYATRVRPAKFMANLDSYYSKLSGNHNVDFVISMDSDDKSMNNLHMMKWLNNKPNLMYFYGESKGKIHAINRDIPSTPWDILVVIADDMEVQEDHWDDIIAKDMYESFPDFSGCVNYNTDPRLETVADGRQEGWRGLITLPVIGRKLYDKFNYIYHPSYISEYCDDEQTIVFTKLNCIKHIDKRPILHNFKPWHDDLMTKNMNIGKTVDYKTYAQRKLINFEMGNT